MPQKESAEKSSKEYVGIRVPGQVKRSWEEQAKKQQRSLSNWILHSLEEYVHSGSNKRPAPSH